MTVEDDPRFKSWHEAWKKKRIYEEFFMAVSMRFGPDNRLYHEALKAKDKSFADLIRSFLVGMSKRALIKIAHYRELGRRSVVSAAQILGF
jgi:hypothetical protein